MSWLAWRDRFWPAPALGPGAVDGGEVLPRGAFLTEFAAPALAGGGRVNLLRAGTRDPAARLTLSLGPRGLELLQGRGDDGRAWSLPLPELIEGEPVIASLQWDIAAGQGMLTAWLPARPTLCVAAAAPAMGLSMAEGLALTDPEAVAHPTGAVAFAALSDRPVATGPVGSLAPDAPVAAPGGALPAGDLRAGDAVMLAGGGLARILWAGRVTLPGLGWYRPHRIRAPYHGALADFGCSGDLGLRLSGGQVEYVFGREKVSAAARQLVDGRSVIRAEPQGPQVWMRFILDRPGELRVGGLTVDGPDIAGLRHDPRLLAVAGFAAMAGLPQWRQAAPRLRDHEAALLRRAQAA